MANFFNMSSKMTAVVVSIMIAIASTSSSSSQPEPATEKGRFSGPIKHVVLLMLENRAFDHMAGRFPNVNGLTGRERNLVNTSNPNGPYVQVQFESPYVGPFDPDHGTSATTHKIFGQQCLNQNCDDPTMDGFIEFASSHHPLNQSKSLMNMFTPERLPVMSTLAKEFAIFDRFFCSHPGPTWPNRLFQLMGTSKGCTATSSRDPKTLLYTGKTVFDTVEEAGHDWKFYFADAPLEASLIAKVATNLGKLHDWHKFHKDIANGELPAFSWVNPRWFVNKTTNEGASDQHPDHDVRMGEALIKEVYEALRSSPKWNETLFIITYDEHGGFYDHVPPPMNVPAPDDSISFPDKNFSFTRLGVRVPVLLVSPWVAKGTVISEPMAHEKPEANSEFDATSIISTVKNLFEAPKFLTKRDKWAATFDKRLTEESPRTDCPMHLPDAPKTLSEADTLREANQPLNDLQTDIVDSFFTLRGLDVMADTKPTTQGEASEWIEKVVADVLAGQNIASAKHSSDVSKK